MKIESLKELFLILKYEVKRYSNRNSIFFTYFIEPRFRINVWFRVGQYLYQYRKLKILCMLIRHHLMFKYGFEIYFNAKIGKGLRIRHLGGNIVINSNSIIGENLTLQNGITIGASGSSNPMKNGVPMIGKNVTISSGAKIVGKCKIGNNVRIGALAFVNFDVPDNGVVIGYKGKIL